MLPPDIHVQLLKQFVIKTKKGINKMSIEVIKVGGIENGFDFDAHYQIKEYRGIAWFALGWEAKNVPIMCICEDENGKEYEEESGEYELEPTNNVVLVMVGDDRKFVFSQDECIKIEEDSFCRECGQIGCGCVVYQ